MKALANERRDECIATTLAPFDALLGGGLPRGKMVELTGRRGTPRYSIVLAALAAATSMGEAAVLVDLGDGFDPQLAEANGVDLRRLLWIRPKTMRQAVMSLEMITATKFQLVTLDCGLRTGKRVPDAAWVRLARSAEAHGAAMLISTPWPLTGTASEAVITALRPRAQWLGRGKSPRVLAGMTVELRLEKHRHRKPGAETTLTLRTAEHAEGIGEVAERRGVTRTTPAHSPAESHAAQALATGEGTASTARRRADHHAAPVASARSLPMRSGR